MRLGQSCDRVYLLGHNRYGGGGGPVNVMVGRED